MKKDKGLGGTTGGGSVAAETPIVRLHTTMRDMVLTLVSQAARMNDRRVTAEQRRVAVEETLRLRREVLDGIAALYRERGEAPCVECGHREQK